MEHGHSATSEMPSHGHPASASTANLTGYFYTDTKYGGSGIVSYTHTSNEGSMNSSDAYGRFHINATHTHTITVENTGGDAAHNIMQPYQVVYRWQRTA